MALGEVCVKKVSGAGSAGRRHRVAGFTLIEMVVVLTVMGIIAAISIPLYLTYRQTTTDAATQSDVAAVAELTGECMRTSGLPDGQFANSFPGGPVNIDHCGKAPVSPTTEMVVETDPGGRKFVVYATSDEGTAGRYYRFCSSTDLAVQSTSTKPDISTCPDGAGPGMQEPDGTPAAAAALFKSHTCYLTNDRHVECWGNNQSGQLGDGTTTSRNMPVEVRGPSGAGLMTDVVSVSVHSMNTCLATAAGEAYCIGDNSRGQLGDGTMTDSPFPVHVQGVSNVERVYVGFYRAYALTSDGSLYAWGYNADGQLGDGTTVTRPTAVQVSGPGGAGYLSGVMGMVVGDYYACAAATGGDLYCWGSNYYGQLGNGTNNNSTIPVKVVMSGAGT